MSLLQMSIFGAIMILAVIVIRALAINRLPKKTFIVLWGIVLLRLLVPFSFPSTFSAYSIINNHIPATQGVAELRNANAFPVMPVQLPTTGGVLQEQTAVSLSPYAIVWGIGLIACALFFAIAYFKCRREFRESLPIKNDFLTQWFSEHKLSRPVEIRQSSRISAPLTYGIFKPIILMPKNTKWEDTKQIEYILAQEFVHIRRFDAATKLLLTAALCIHWFNPLVWAMYILSNRDIELSCDETVIHSFGETTKSTYALTLISMEEKKSSLTPLCNNFSKNAIEERITAIMKLKKTSIVATLVAFSLIIGVTTAFATSATPVSAMGNTQISRAMNPIRISGKEIAAGGKISLGSQPLVAGTDCKVLLTFTGDSKLTVLCVSTNGATKSLLVESGKAATLQIEADEKYTISVKNDNAYTIGNVNGTIEFMQSSGLQDYEEYAKWGIQIKDGVYYYNNDRVRIFMDMRAEGSFEKSFVDDNGKVDVRLIRNVSGSITQFELIEDKEAQKILDDLNGSPSVTYSNVEMRRYEGADGHPYIHDTKVNETTKKIIGYKYGMLAFDKGGNPLKINWQSLDTEAENTYFYLGETLTEIAPAETYDVFGGWSLNFYGTDLSVEQIAYVLYCDKEITFEDGTTWTNPNFNSWRSTHEGKKVDVNILKGYYPYEQTINFAK